MVLYNYTGSTACTAHTGSMYGTYHAHKRSKGFKDLLEIIFSHIRMYGTHIQSHGYVGQLTGAYSSHMFILANAGHIVILAYDALTLIYKLRQGW